MKVIKRNGTIVDFNINKIETAITNAFKDIKINSPHIEMDPIIIAELAEEVKNSLKCFQDAVSVEDIQDMVEETLMKNDFYEVSRAYIRYRYKKELLRNNRQNVYESVLQLVDLKNEELKDENSNKNAIIASTQRDYMAGEVSKELSKQFLLPFDVLDAHEKGIIHFHDMDYYAQHIHNCCLVNLDDMLQNGTVINGTLIQKPHSFLTACNIATQIMAVVASGQYGGQSITLSHLAPFVDISRQKIKNEIIQEFYSSRGLEDHMDEKINELTNKRLKKEIKAGVQTIQYQINTLNTSNGQTPFVTIFMYLGEIKDPHTKEDLALIIEEVLKQRIEGTQNEKGAWITPAFPKLIYCLEEDNIHLNGQYWYLTELAAKCSAKRLVPDYISEKKMLELKNDVYPCMGCRSFLTPDRFTSKGIGNIANAKNYKQENKYYGRLTA